MSYSLKTYLKTHLLQNLFFILAQFCFTSSIINTYNTGEESLKILEEMGIVLGILGAGFLSTFYIND